MGEDSKDPRECRHREEKCRVGALGVGERCVRASAGVAMDLQLRSQLLLAFHHLPQIKNQDGFIRWLKIQPRTLLASTYSPPWRPRMAA